jgi:hypothetical protein
MPVYFYYLLTRLTRCAGNVIRSAVAASDGNRIFEKDDGASMMAEAMIADAHRIAFATKSFRLKGASYREWKDQHGI